MLEVYAENKRGLKIKLSPREDLLQFDRIDGLFPVNAEINSSSNVFFDGERLNDSRIPARLIRLIFFIKGDAEENRNLLYQVFTTKNFVRLYIKTRMKNVFIEGTVDKFDGNPFEFPEKLVVEIKCHDPFFKQVGETTIDLSKEFENFIFPFAINENGIEFSTIDPRKVTNVINSGEVETGLIISIKSRLNDIKNPIIINTKTNEFFKLNDTLYEGETIIINTNNGCKKVIKYDADGKEFNIINRVADNSNWFKLSIGNNYFTYDEDSHEVSTYLDVNFIYNNLFIGV